MKKQYGFSDDGAGWHATPDQLWKDRKVLMLWTYLRGATSSFCWKDNTFHVWASAPRIAKDLGFSVTAIKRAIGRAVQYGLLTYDHPPGNKGTGRDRGKCEFILAAPPDCKARREEPKSGLQNGQSGLQNDDEADCKARREKSESGLQTESKADGIKVKNSQEQEYEKERVRKKDFSQVVPDPLTLTSSDGDMGVQVPATIIKGTDIVTLLGLLTRLFRETFPHARFQGKHITSAFLEKVFSECLDLGGTGAAIVQQMRLNMSDGTNPAGIFKGLKGRLRRAQKEGRSPRSHSWADFESAATSLRKSILNRDHPPGGNPSLAAPGEATATGPEGDPDRLAALYVECGGVQGLTSARQHIAGALKENISATAIETAIRAYKQANIQRVLQAARTGTT